MTAVTLVRHIKARPSTVFELLSTADGLTSWWGPDDFPLLLSDTDVRVGGRFRVRFRTTDGLSHECAGEFLEIEPCERIAMSWEWTSGGEAQERGNVSRLEFNLQPTETGTELTLVHSGMRDASQSGHTYGWGKALDKLVALFDVAQQQSSGDPVRH